MAFERKPHKWAEAIKAWADGKPIQYKPNKESCWIDYDPEYARQRGINRDFYSSNIPKFDEYEWRVKPERVDTYHLVEYMGEGDVEMYSSENLKANLRLTFEDKKLVKAEVIGNE